MENGDAPQPAHRPSWRPFATRDNARQAPQRLREQAPIDQATGVIIAIRGLDEQGAREVLARAAKSAGLAPLQIAKAITEPYLRGGGDHG